MKKTTLFKFMPFILALMILLFGCKPNLSQKIAELEKQMLNAEGALNPEIGEELVADYCAYADENQGDEQSAKYLFKAIDISVNLSNPQRTLTLADRLQKEYPDYEMTPMAMFIKGFVYETQLNNVDEARKAYQTYIDQYPNHEFVDDAQGAIENLGLSPEELIRKFEKMNEN